jgi:hypothetical protein
MKYFTPSMWLGLQGSSEQSGENHRRWESAFKEYRQQLAALRGRLSGEAFSFFDEADIHDGELLSFRIVDGSRAALLTNRASPWETLLNYPVRVELAVLDARDELVWHLSYSVLRSVVVDYPGQETLFYQVGAGFGDWGYHELTDAGNGFLRHEILFASGSSLAIEFKGLAVERTHGVTPGPE